MKTQVEINEGKAVATFDGRMESHLIHEVTIALTPLFSLKNTDITLNCSKLTYISSNGLRLLHTLIMTVRPNRCNLYIQGASDYLMKVLEKTGFDKCFFFK